MIKKRNMTLIEIIRLCDEIDYGMEADLSFIINKENKKILGINKGDDECQELYTNQVTLH